MKSSKKLCSEQDNKTEFTMSGGKPETVEDALQREEYTELLDTSRERLDAIDDQILELVAQRMEIAGEILSAKQLFGIKTRDKNRQEQILVRINTLAGKFVVNGVVLNKHQIRQLYELLIRLGVENWRRSAIDDQCFID